MVFYNLLLILFFFILTDKHVLLYEWERHYNFKKEHRHNVAT